jgi:hypothetical protein
MSMIRSAPCPLLSARHAGPMAPADLAQKKVELDKEIKIKDWGYQIRPIKGWNTMPADQDDRLHGRPLEADLDRVREARQLRGLPGRRPFCELMIMRIQTQGRDAERQPRRKSGVEGKSALPASLGQEAQPEDHRGVDRRQLGGASEALDPQPLKGGKMPGEVLEFGSGASTSRSACSAPRRRVGVVYEAFEENYRKTWRDIYLKSMQTFKVTEKVDPEVAQANGQGHQRSSKGEEKREALKASIAGNPGWYSIDTKYYVFLSNARPPVRREALARTRDRARAVYIPNFKPRNEKIPLSPVRVFAPSRIPPVRRPQRLGRLLQPVEGRAGAVREVRGPVRHQVDSLATAAR